MALVASIDIHIRAGGVVQVLQLLSHRSSDKLA